MPQRGIGDPAVDMRCRRERRVHQHDGRTDVGIEMIVNMRSVMPGDVDAAEQLIEQACASISELIEMQLRASELGINRKEPRASRGFEHEIVGRDRRRYAGDETEFDRRGELLERLALLGAARMRRNERREFFQHSEECTARCGALAHRRCKLAQEQNLRRLAGVVGDLPIPSAFRVRTAEGRAHRIAQRLRIDCASAFKIGEEQPGRGDKCCAGIR